MGRDRVRVVGGGLYSELPPPVSTLVAATAAADADGGVRAGLQSAAGRLRGRDRVVVQVATRTAIAVGGISAVVSATR